MNLTAFVLCHKLEHFVDRAIASLLTQTHLPDHIVLLGTDCRSETYDAFKRWENHAANPTIVMTERRLTCMQSKNYAAQIILKGNEQSPYVSQAFFVLDADDWLMPNFIYRCMGYMEGSNAAAVGCDYQIVHHDGRITPAGVHQTRTITQENITQANPLPACSIVRLSAFNEAGGYREDFIYEDWGLWAKMLTQGHRIFRFPQILFNHYRHETNITNSVDPEKGREQIKCLMSATTARPSAPRS